MKKVKQTKQGRNLVCPECGTAFVSTNAKATYCSDECRRKKNYRYLNEQRRAKNDVLYAGKLLNVEYIECPYCGFKTTAITLAHLKTHDKTFQSMKVDFPDQLVFAKNCSEKWTGDNSHMKKQEYKDMFSEKFKGEKNPNHRSKSSKQERKERSPKCIEFYVHNHPDKTLEECQEMLNEHIATTFEKIAETSPAIRSTKLDFYLEKGLSEKEAKIELSKRQSTFSLHKCIEKYGEEEGNKVWKNRQRKWKSTMIERNNFARGHSEVGDKFITKLLIELENLIPIEECKYGNQELCLMKSDDSYFLYDFTFKNKIIEFNGDYWHCNPNDKHFNNKNYFHKLRNKTAEEIWQFDNLRKQIALDNKYELMCIWESDYVSDPKSTIDNAVKFLTNANEI